MCIRDSAAELANLDTVPVIVRNMEDDAATILMLSLIHIFTIDKSRAMKYLGHLNPEEMRRVDDAVRISLALNLSLIHICWMYWMSLNVCMLAI